MVFEVREVHKLAPLFLPACVFVDPGPLCVHHSIYVTVGLLGSSISASVPIYLSIYLSASPPACPSVSALGKSAHG